jgi:putative peptide zinc metalloprotease protein
MPDGRSPAQVQPGSDAAQADGRTDGRAHQTNAQPRIPATPEVQVPERPSLAPGVKPAGQMKESAFKEPPWLLEQDGAGYVQVTELLYRVAENCDGQSSLEDIAGRVSETTGRQVSAANVQQLVAGQLLHKGLVGAPGGSATARPRAGLRSPLAINMRMKMISPPIIDAITGGLRVLYWPPVLIGVLILAALAQAWMYFVHGVGASVHDALYAPGLLLAVLAVIVAVAAFHELGHAAALRYAGGKVKGMGAGIYLVYPAFFTDVSDNYQLPRWSRVRTDLGGFYFNLIFVLGIMALYVATGHEFLLLIVVLINLEIIHQLLPFVRLDGYWTLADITGVPDFFSQMGAFLRSMLPVSGWKGRKLPELKWWAKAIFVLYMLITVPVLLLVLFLMIKAVPRVLATAWDSFWQQAGVFAGAQGAGDLLGATTAVVQMLVLGLPTLGLLYTLYSLARRTVTAVWNWSKPTPTRRILGSLGTTAALGLVAFLWAPQLPFAGGQPGLLYNVVSFRPITRDERGTIFEAIGLGAAPARAAVGREPAVPEATPEADTAPTAAPTAASEARAESVPERDDYARDRPRTTFAPTAVPKPGPAKEPTRAPALAPTTTVGPALGLTPAVEPTLGPGAVPTAAPAPTATPAP